MSRVSLAHHGEWRRINEGRLALPTLGDPLTSPPVREVNMAEGNMAPEMGAVHNSDYGSLRADEAREQRALAALDRFISENAEDLRAIVGWGDGRGGAIAERIAEALLDPVSEAPVPGRSRAISARVRRLVMERDQYRCVKCGSHKALRIDHVFPWSRGGSNEPANLQTLCHPCNQAKGARIEGAAP